MQGCIQSFSQTDSGENFMKVSTLFFVCCALTLVGAGCDEHDHDHSHSGGEGDAGTAAAREVPVELDASTEGEGDESAELSTGLDGEYENDEFGTRLSIDGTTWNEGSIDMSSEFAYEVTNTLVSVLSDSAFVFESGYAAGTFDVVVTVAGDTQGSFYACTVAFGLASVEEAEQADLSVADTENPSDGSACGGSFPFTLWMPVADAE